MKKDVLITLRTFSNEVDAQVALQHLKSNHIEAILKKDDSGGMRPHLQITIGVDILVAHKDLAKAESVLNAMKV
jgi:hypothetical protein